MTQATYTTYPVNIIVISRLAYRKGVDLLVATAPKICAKFPQVRFIIGEYIDSIVLYQNSYEPQVKAETGQN